MKTNTLALALAAVFPSVARATLIWPVPQSIELGQVEVELDPDFHITGPKAHHLQDAIDRYSQLITEERWIPVQVPYDQNRNFKPNVSRIALTALNIVVEDKHQKLEFEVDESYELNIPVDQKSATLKAKTIWGSIRGLETFSQLIQSRPEENEDGDEILFDFDEDEEQDSDMGFEGLYIPNAPIRIKDAPKYAHRGLMLDTSRNYFPVKDILRTIDAMSFNKMNVFHWHLTDSHSFPLRLKNSPELARQGAYKLQQRRLVYTPQDVREVINYAYQRGVRVIPEIDMPAHTGSWALSHKDITTCAGLHYLDKSGDWSKRLASEPGTGQLNPILDKTYDIVNKVIDEVASLFPDKWFHGGGDEPVYNCWKKDKNIRKYMQVHNATGVDLLHMFLKKELNMIRDSSKTAIIWEDPVTNDNLPLSNDTVLQVWTNSVQVAVKKGYKVIASSHKFWYLDCGHGGWSGNDISYDEQVPPEIPQQVSDVLEKYSLVDNYNPPNWGGSGGDWCSPYKSWQRVYSYDLAFNLTKTESENILGGEVCLWTEQVDTTTLDTRLWPRSAAAAEVMWSGRYDENNVKRDIGDAMPRMFDWRYRLLKRGIQTEAIQPLWCGQNPHMCDATFPAVFETT